MHNATENITPTFVAPNQGSPVMHPKPTRKINADYTKIFHSAQESKPDRSATDAVKAEDKAVTLGSCRLYTADIFITILLKTCGVCTTTFH